MEEKIRLQQKKVGKIYNYRGLYKMRNDSVILDNMCGLYKSTLSCPDCQKISITFDPFFSVSVPIPSNEKIKVQLYVVNENHIPTMLEVYIESSKTVQALFDIV